MPTIRSALYLCLLLAPLPAPARARTLTHHDHPLVGDVSQAALAFARGQLGSLGADGATLRLHRTIQLRGGQVVQLRQEHRGLPVLDADLSVLVLDGRVAALSGSLHALTSTAAPGRLTRAQAEQTVAAALPTAVVRRARQVYWSRGQQALPAWELDVASSSPFGLWRVLVDARSGALLWRLSTIVEAKASVYPTNPTVSALTQVDLNGLTQTGTLTGAHADVQSCGYIGGQVTCERLAAPDAQGDYLYQPDEPSVSDPFAEVQAYYHVDAFHAWLASRFGFARLGSQQIDVMVNLHSVDSTGKQQGMSNAFFGDLDGDGSRDLVFGQGQRDFAYDADVIFHEFTHSAVNETSDLTVSLDELGFNMMPAGLNEGFADLMSCAYTGDPKVGEYAGGSNGIRNLSGTALTCPRMLTGESHSDGLVWGRANWAIRSQLATPADYDAVLYKTMAALSKNASMADASALLLKIAGQADPSMAAAAKTELGARGLLDCTRVMTLEQGDSPKGNIYGTSMVPGVVPGPMQYRIDVPADATRLTVQILGTGWGGSGGSTNLGAYLRKGEPVAFLSKKHDLILPNTDSSIALIKGDKATALEPGASYYVLPLNVGPNQLTYQISFSLEREPPASPDAAVQPSPDTGAPDPDAGASPADPVDPASPTGSGGGCRLGPTPSTGGLWPLLAQGLLALRSRRRRPTRTAGNGRTPTPRRSCGCSQTQRMPIRSRLTSMASRIASGPR